jgi:hypothetical protein
VPDRTCVETVAKSHETAGFDHALGRSIQRRSKAFRRPPRRIRDEPVRVHDRRRRAFAGIDVEWDNGARLTWFGQRPCFIEFVN